MFNFSFKGHLSLLKTFPINLTSRKPTRSLGRSWKIWITQPSNVSRQESKLSLVEEMNSLCSLLSCLSGSGGSGRPDLMFRAELAVLCCADLLCSYGFLRHSMWVLLLDVHPGVSTCVPLKENQCVKIQLSCH